MAGEDHQEHGNGHGRRHLNHFLVVAFGIQGHVSPARALAGRLARADGSTLATLSVPVSGHRHMFPSLAFPNEEVSDGVVSYVPYSDGFDDGGRPKDADERARSRRATFESLSAVLRRLAAAGHPVTCIVSAFLPSAADVAREHGLPLAFYWIQPAAVLVVYYHYFHWYGELIASHAADPTYEVCLPGLRPLRIRNFPSFLVDTTHSELSEFVLQMFRALFDHLDQEAVDGGGKKPKLLVNTFDALEATAVRAMQPYLDVFAVGPTMQQGEATGARVHLFKKDEGHMEWLGARPERSVVYVSFGSVLTYSRRQVEEMLRGLRECARPYLWVVRKDGRDEEADHCLGEVLEEEGMVVEWCDQVEVLSHPAVGCFVTHCGWNSTLEAIAFGVPMVAAPNWSDQATNACLVEEEWGVGVKAERDGVEGVLPGAELARCVELVMGDGENAAAIREKARHLKERAQEAVATGGPSEISLRRFVREMQAAGKIREENSQSVNLEPSEAAT